MRRTVKFGSMSVSRNSGASVKNGDAMAMRYLSACLSLVILISLAGFSATAHHNGGVYFDLNVELQHENVTVVDYQLFNPHGRLIYLVTDDDGNEMEWSAELASANNLRRSGIGNEMFRPGDKLKLVAGAPGLTEPNFMRLSRAEFPNGDVAIFSGGGTGIRRAGE